MNSNTVRVKQYGKQFGQKKMNSNTVRVKQYGKQFGQKMNSLAYLTKVTKKNRVVGNKSDIFVIITVTELILLLVLVPAYLIYQAVGVFALTWFLWYIYY